MAKTYSAKRKTMEVPIEQEDGNIKIFLMKDLTGTDRDAYLNKIAGKVKMDSDGKPTGVKDFTGLHADLLALCMFDESGAKVDKKIIQEWPSTLQMDLFEEAQKLCGLDKKADETAKND
jgi:hypothetical protein